MIVASNIWEQNALRAFTTIQAVDAQIAHAQKCISYGGERLDVWKRRLDFLKRLKRDLEIRAL